VLHLSRLALTSSLVTLLAAGCGGATSSGSGGEGGSETGGTTGGGGTGGKVGTGGNMGTGGSVGTGGSTGTGGAGGGQGGTGGSKPDGGAGMGGGGPGTGGTGGGGSGGGTTLDQCFANLPTLNGSYQISTKASADGGTRIRVALEVNGFGTSGTKAWALIRFGIERGTNSACVTDMAQLKYTTSHHNCADKATATAANGVVYAITAPDRPTAMVSASGAAAFPPVTVTQTACKSSDQNMCRSGGPCQ